MPISNYYVIFNNIAIANLLLNADKVTSALFKLNLFKVDNRLNMKPFKSNTEDLDGFWSIIK